MRIPGNFERLVVFCARCATYLTASALFVFGILGLAGCSAMQPATPGGVQGGSAANPQSQTHTTASASGPLKFVSISAGGQTHSCGIATDGKAYCWGGVNYGETGILDLAPGSKPSCLYGCLTNVAREVSGGLTFSSIVAVGYHTCALTPDGSAYCWGRNDYGQLGDGTTTDRYAPVPVTGGLKFTSLASGMNSEHTCGITEGGDAYCWGSNFHGTLGNGEATRPDLTPNPVPVRVLGGLKFKSLTTGYMHTCGIAETGLSYCWGYNYNGQLGVGRPSDPDSHYVEKTPTPVSCGYQFAHISGGGYNTCAVTPSGETYCWGPDWYANLGDPSIQPEDNIAYFAPHLVPTDLRFTQISAGGASCGLTAEGAAHCWGTWLAHEMTRNCYGSPCSTAIVPVVGGITFEKLSSGGAHTCAISTTGDAYCWGRSVYGELGNGSNSDSTVPVMVRR